MILTGGALGSVLSVTAGAAANGLSVTSPDWSWTAVALEATADGAGVGAGVSPAGAPVAPAATSLVFASARMINGTGVAAPVLVCGF